MQLHWVVLKVKLFYFPISSVCFQVREKFRLTGPLNSTIVTIGSTNKFMLQLWTNTFLLFKINLVCIVFNMHWLQYSALHCTAVVSAMASQWAAGLLRLVFKFLLFLAAGAAPAFEEASTSAADSQLCHEPLGRAGDWRWFWHLHYRESPSGIPNILLIFL